MTFTTTAEDLDFSRQMEACGYPASEFDHRAHLRLAYVYLCDASTESATLRMTRTLKGYLRHNGADPIKFHATLTRAWILAVHHFMNQAMESNSADSLIDRYPDMLDSRIMMTHYSAALLFSDAARQSFVPPDLEPIPRYGN